MLASFLGASSALLLAAIFIPVEIARLVREVRS